MADNKDIEIKQLDLTLDGKLVTGIDGALIGANDFQVLKNMRYTDVCPKGIYGMTAINTTNHATVKYIKSGIHYQKSQPAESHVLYQATDVNGANGILKHSTVAIPGTTDFNAGTFYTEASGHSVGKFTIAPDDCVVYCNSKESLIFGGSEYRIGLFYNRDFENTISYDYSDKLNENLNVAASQAQLYSVSNAIDANVVTLLHLDNDVVDSSTSATKTWTNNSVTFDNADKVFGTYSGVFNGTTGSLSTPDHADFDFSDGLWEIDTRIKVSSFAGINPIYSQYTDADNYILFEVLTGGELQFSIKATTITVSLASAAGAIAQDTWHHVAIVENGSVYTLYIDNKWVASRRTANRPANYSALPTIGSSTFPTNVYFNGKMDEPRISKVSRWTGAFVKPTVAYGSTDDTICYIGATRAIQGIKFYVATANTNTATVTGYYWDGTGFVSVSSLTDGTASAGKTLAATGSVSFTSTVGLAKPSLLHNNMAYWYVFVFNNLSSGTKIYYTTIDTPIQPIVDLWDGEFRKCVSAQQLASDVYTDFTSNIIDNEWVDGFADTYIDLNGLIAVNANSLIFGFLDKTCGIQLNIANGYTNTAATNVIQFVDYWNGSAWTSVGAFTDGTRNLATGSGSLFKSGTVSWSPITTAQFPYSLNNELPLYYYRIRMANNIAVAIRLYGVLGIPQPEDIANYKFPIMWQKRLGLCTNVAKQKNELLLGAPHSVTTFNGTSSVKLYIGDNSEFTAAGSLFSRYGASIYESLVITKSNSVFILDGSEPKNYVTYQTAENFGCPASETFKMCDLGYEIAAGLNKHVLIWQTSSDIVLFDGNSIMPISKDIDNLFDPNASDHINFSKLDKSTGFFDPNLKEYHWCFMGGTSTVINREFVYDLVHKKWFEVDRTSGKYATCGFIIQDTAKRKYVYSGTDADNIYRLENGTDFDGTVITYTWRTGDKPLSKSIMHATRIRRFKIPMKLGS